MIHGAATKEKPCYVSTGVSNTATAAGATVDTKGYNYALFNVVASVTGLATNAVFNTLQVEECDTTVASSFATISGYKAGTDYTIPTQVATAGGFNTYRIGMPLNGRMRYLRVKVKSTNVTHVGYSHCQLSRAAQMPNTTTESGTVLDFQG